MPDTLRFDHLALPDGGGKPWLMMFSGSGQLLALCALCGAQPGRADGLPQPAVPAAQRVQHGIAAHCGGGAAARE